MKQDLINAIEQNNIQNIKTLVQSGTDINTPFVRAHTSVMPNKQNEISRAKRSETIINTLLNVGTFGLLGRMNEMFAQNSAQPIRSIERPTDSESDLKYYAYSPLSYAVKNNNFSLTKILIELEADIDITFDNYQADDTEIIRYSPLGWSIVNSNLAMVELLLKHGVNVNKTFECNKLSPLNIAVMDNNINIVKLLLTNSANVDIKTADGFTPLGCAIAKGNFKMIKLLIEHKADINTTFGEYTPLGYAVVENHLEVVRLLVESGADTSATFTHHKEEYSPLDYAKKEGHSKMIEIFGKNSAI